MDWNVVKTLIGYGIWNVPLPSLLFQWKHTDSVERLDAWVSLQKTIYEDRELGLHWKPPGGQPGLLFSHNGLIKCIPCIKLIGVIESYCWEGYKLDSCCLIRDSRCLQVPKKAVLQLLIPERNLNLNTKLASLCGFLKTCCIEKKNSLISAKCCLGKYLQDLKYTFTYLLKTTMD